MKLLKYKVVFVLITLGFPELLLAQAYISQTGDVEFQSSVPLHSFKGKSNHLVGKITLTDSTVDFYVDLNTLDTGIGKRDRDMRETLEVKKYPFAEFYGKLISPFDFSIKEAQKVSVKGTFKVHGVATKVTIDGKLTPTSQGLQIESSWALKLKDYHIEPPGILFYKVDQEQHIHIKALLISSN